MRKAGIVLLCVVIGAAILAPWLAPNDPDRRFPDLIYAPPTAAPVRRRRRSLYI